MCSIGGFISKEPLDPEDAERLCQALIYYGRDRGQQSAGVYVNGKLLKKACDPWSFTHTQEFRDLFVDGAKMALTHTRTPTCGGLGDEQAQPFKGEHVVTVHNGHFSMLKELKEQWNITKPSGVDSELVATFIDNHGIHKLHEFLDSAIGSAAIGAIVKDPGTQEDWMFLMRDSNPTWSVHFKIGKDNEICIFGSTRDQVTWAARYVFLVNAWLDRDADPTDDGQLYLVEPSGLQKVKDCRTKIRTYKGYSGGTMWPRAYDGYEGHYDRGGREVRTWDETRGRWSGSNGNGIGKSESKGIDVNHHLSRKERRRQRRIREAIDKTTEHTPTTPSQLLCEGPVPEGTVRNGFVYCGVLEGGGRLWLPEHDPKAKEYLAKLAKKEENGSGYELLD